jgi:hypothetical protein
MPAQDLTTNRPRRTLQMVITPFLDVTLGVTACPAPHRWANKRRTLFHG